MKGKSTNSLSLENVSQDQSVYKIPFEASEKALLAQPEASSATTEEAAQTTSVNYVRI